MTFCLLLRHLQLYLKRAHLRVVRHLPQLGQLLLQQHNLLLKLDPLLLLFSLHRASRVNTAALLLVNARHRFPSLAFFTLALLQAFTQTNKLLTHGLHLCFVRVPLLFVLPSQLVQLDAKRCFSPLQLLELRFQLLVL